MWNRHKVILTLYELGWKTIHHSLRPMFVMGKMMAKIRVKHQIPGEDMGQTAKWKLMKGRFTTTATHGDGKTELSPLVPLFFLAATKLIFFDVQKSKI